MNFKIFVPMILLGLAASANAVSLPNKLPMSSIGLPGASIGAVITIPTLINPITPSLNALSLPRTAPMSLPAPVPSAIHPARLPSVPSSLPLPTRAVLADVRRSAPSIIEHFVLDWSALNGGDGAEPAPALVPVDPGPKPLAPAGAMNELRDIAAGREPIRIEVMKIFDGRRETIREIALPYEKFF